MLQNLLYIIFVSAICICWGLPFAYVQQKQRNESVCRITGEVLVMSFFTGLIIIALLSSWFMLSASPLGFWPFCGFAFIALMWRSKVKFQLAFGSFKLNGLSIFIITAILLFIFLGSGKPVMEDTELYHVQIIRWDQYGPVPGLANLYLRDGFYSNWFHLISTFALPFKHENFLFLNVTVGIWFFLFLATRLKKSIFYFFIMIYMLVEWDLARANASSTSYDFIVTALMIIILTAVIENKNQYFFTTVLAAVSLPFFKISGTPILVILLVYFFITKQPLKKYLVTAVMFLLFLLPYISKNYIQTGYPLYPYTAFSNFSTPDWKVPEQLVTRFSDYMALSNRYINQSIPEYAWQNPGDLSGWIYGWLQHLTLTDKLLCGFAILTLIVSFFIRMPKHTKIIYYTCAALLLLWFFTSPDPRFAYGSLLFIAFLPLSFLLKKVPLVRIQWVLLAAAAGILVYGYFKRDNFNLIHPPAIEVPPFQKINGFHLPERINNNWNIRCYDTPLPCICQLNPYLEARGKNISDGFRMKSITDSLFILKFNY